MSVIVTGNITLGSAQGNPTDIYLEDLKDVDIVSPLTGQYLRYNGTTTDWQNAFINADVYSYLSTSMTSSNGITLTTNSGTLAFAFSLTPSGVTAGSYNNVTVDTYGRVLSGTMQPYITGNQTITISGDASGTGSTSIALTLASVGSAGTYTKVTTDSKGRITSGTNPTTLAGYGITDALHLSGGNMTGSIVFPGTSGITVTGIPLPIGSSDVSNKIYVDTSINQFSWKQVVQAATTVNITLSGTQTIDGYAAQIGDRILVKNQTNQTQNGIYIVQSGTWTLSVDSSALFLPGATVSILNGSTQSTTLWLQTTPAPITIGTSNIVWVEFSSSTTYSAGTGLSLIGTTFANTGVLSNIAGTGISVSGATGNITITNTGVTSLTAGANINVSASTGAITVGLATQPTIDGTNFTNIPNSALINSSVTIGSTNIALGGTATTLAGLISVTATTFLGNASTASSIFGGSANEVLFQSAASTTTFNSNFTYNSTSGALTIGGNAITLGGAFTTSGANPITLTTTGPTNITLPTSGTLATTSQITSGLPSATTSQLYGGSGTAGVAQVVTVGSNLVLSSGTLALQTNPSLGSATATTQAYNDNSTKIATTAFNQSLINASMSSVPLSGITGGTYSFASLGSGLSITYSTSGGAISSVSSIISGGSGYAVGDIVNIMGANGNQDSALVVTSISGSSVTALTILYGGTGYTGTGVTGSGIQFNTTLPASFALSGTLTSNATFIVPAGTRLFTSKQWVVNNNTTGAFTVTWYLSNGSGGTIGTGTIIPQGSATSATTYLHTDGVIDVWPVSILIPTATTSQLYGGTGIKGYAQPITVGTGLILTSGTLSTSGVGSVTTVSIVSANGLAGTVANASSTPAITLSTTISGLLKGNGTAISAAISGTDYAPPTSGNSILYGNGSGGFSNVTLGSGLSFSSGTLSATNSGSVTTVSVVSANGFAGTVANASSTPAITLTTSITGLLKGNGTAISTATSGTDYAPATSGSSILYGNGSGGFSNVTVGSGLTFSSGTLSATGGTFTLTSGSTVSGSSASAITFEVNGTNTNTTMIQVASDATIPSTATTEVDYFRSVASTAVASFTLPTLIHYDAQQGTFGAGSSVTSQYGFYSDSTLISATNNYGFYGNIPAATHNWNFYAPGTAHNYMAGNLLLGTTTDNNVDNLQVAGTILATGVLKTNGSVLTLAGNLTTSGTFATTLTTTGTTSVTLPTSGTLLSTTSSAGSFPTLNQNTTGNAATATTSSNISLATTGANATFYIPFANASSGSSIPLTTDTLLTFNPNTNVLSASTFNGALSSNSTATTQPYTDNSTKIATTAFNLTLLNASMSTVPLSGITGGTYNFATNGSGVTFVYHTNSGAINSIGSISAGGSGYAVGDLINAVGSSNGNQDAVLQVSSVSGTSVTGLSILYGGTGYTGTASAGAGATYDTTLATTYTLTGTLTSNATFIVPAGTRLFNSNQWIVNNNTTGAFTVAWFLSNGTGGTIGSGTVIPQGTNNSTASYVQTDGVTDVWSTTHLLPSATTSQLYGGSGSAGLASIVSVGTGLALSSGTLSTSNIPNSSLTNSSLTIGSTNIALGATSTTLAGLTSVTATTFNGALSGNATSATNIAGGSTNQIPYQSAASTTAFNSNLTFTAGSGLLAVPLVATSGTISGSLTQGAYSYGTLSYSDTNIFESLQTSANSYAQVILQNTNSGATASTDFVVSNDVGTATTHYGNLGINSSGFTGSGSFNLANAVYMTATTGDLAIGTTTSNSIRMVVNSQTTDSIAVAGSTGNITLTGLTDAQNGTSTGGTITLSGGVATNSATTGGSITLSAGNNTNTTSGVGGAINITAGNASGTTSGNGGAITLTAGSSTSQAAGTITLQGSDSAATSSFRGSSIFILAGRTNATLAGGDISITAGANLNATSGNGGQITIQGGAATISNGGNIVINGGAAGSSGSGGVINIGASNTSSITVGNTTSNNTQTITIESGSGGATFRTANANTSGSTTGTVTITTGSNSDTGASSTGSITVTTGNVSGTSASGALTIHPGDSSGTTATSLGTLTIRGANNSNTGSGTGGDITITGGGAVGSARAGNITITAGATTGANGGNGGNLTINSGTSGSGTAGSISIGSTASSSIAFGSGATSSITIGLGSTGTVSLVSALSSSATTGGITIRSGAGTSNSSGDVTVQSGAATGSGKVTGNIIIDVGAATSSATAGAVNLGTTNATTVTIGNTTNITTLSLNTAPSSTSSAPVTINGGNVSYILSQSSIPFIIPSSGTMGNNGALSAITALQTTYSGGCYMHFPTNAISSGSAAGWYWTVMSSTTAGTVYNSTYTSGTPTTGTTTAFSTTGPGAYTQSTGSLISGPTLTIPANVLGANGRFMFEMLGANNNTANNKTYAFTFGGTQFWQFVPTTTTASAFRFGIVNKNSLSSNVGFPASASSAFGGVAATLSYGTINTGSAQNAIIAMQLATATDTVMIDNYMLTIYPG